MNRFLTGTATVLLALFALSGCTEKDDDSNNVSGPGLSHLPTYAPKGTITGLVRDRITNQPVSGAVVSVGFDGSVHSVTSNAAGAFSFADVPAGQYQIVNGQSVLSGTYTLTVSMTAVNAAQTNPAKKYRDTYYSTVTIRFTSLAGGDTTASDGMVGSVVLGVSYLNTTVTGQVVDKNMAPVANAVVTLLDATVFPNIALGQTTTGPNGIYSFANVDNGLTVDLKAESADGALEANLPGTFTLPANVMNDSMRTQVTAERMMLLPSDDTNPFVTLITPENMSDVPAAGLTVVYSFSEPVKQTPYTRTDLPPGHGTIADDIVISYNGFKKGMAEIAYTLQWNASFTQLTFTPQGVVGSSKYSVDFTGAAGSGQLMDAAGNALVNNGEVTGDFEVLNLTTAGNSALPAAPVLKRRIVQGQFAELDYNGGTVGLAWAAVTDARSYNVYRSLNGGSFELLQGDFFNTQLSTASGSLVTPSGANNPLAAANVRYYVKAVSKDLAEGPASNIVTVADSVRPSLINATVAAGTGTNTWLYTVRFTEPMKSSTVENGANFTFSNTGGVTYTIQSADYLGLVGGQYRVQLTVVSSAAPVAGYILTIGNAVTDLAGLSISSAANSQNF